MSLGNISRQSISASGELPQELTQVKAGSLETKQALDKLGKIGTSSTPPLGFSFRSLLSKIGINPGAPANQASQSGKAQKLPQSTGQTAPKGIASKPAIDVKTLSGAEGQNVKDKVMKYDDLRGAALKMLTGGGKASFDWKPLSSSSSKLHASVKEPAAQTFKDLKVELEAIGFKAGGGSDEGFYHEGTGTRVAVLCDQKTQEISLFVEGLQSPGSKGFGARLKEIVSDSLGLKSGSRDLAIDLGKALNKLPSATRENMSIVGHSHGGSIAQTAALVGGINAVCFNSRRVGGKTQESIGQENIIQNEGKITHFNKPDFLTKRGGVVSQLVKAGNAASFGKEYSIPPSPGAKGLVAIHNDTAWPSNISYTTDTEDKSHQAFSLNNRMPLSKEAFSQALNPPSSSQPSLQSSKVPEKLDLGEEV